MTKQEILDRFKDINEAYNDSSRYDSLAQMLDELLEEQEAVEPVMEQESTVCGVCGHDVIWTREIENNYTTDYYCDFCPHCGRPVKWE